jgi:DNA-binding transcriptional LysR family regulator
MVDLKLLYYFTTVAEELSFSGAARRLFVSVAAVSAGVRTLENRLGVELFTRSSRHVELTTTGYLLLADAQLVLQAAEAFETRASALGGRATLRVGTVSGLGGGLLADAAKRLALQSQPVDLEFHVTDWTEPTAGLAARRSDVAILVGPTSHDPELRRVRLWDERLFALLPSSHLAAGRKEITLPELDQVGFAWCRAGDEKAHGFWRLDHIRGGPPQRAKQFETPQELFLGIRSGQGVCCIPESFSEQFGLVGLAKVPVAGVPMVAVDVARRKDRGSVTVDAFMGVVSQLVDETGERAHIPA